MKNGENATAALTDGKSHGTGNVVAKAIFAVTNLLTVLAVVGRRTLLVAQIFEALKEDRHIVDIQQNVVGGSRTGLHLQVPSHESQCSELFPLH